MAVNSHKLYNQITYYSLAQYLSGLPAVQNGVIHHRNPEYSWLSKIWWRENNIKTECIEFLWPFFLLSVLTISSFFLYYKLNIIFTKFVKKSNFNNLQTLKRKTLSTYLQKILCLKCVRPCHFKNHTRNVSYFNSNSWYTWKFVKVSIEKLSYLTRNNICYLNEYKNKIDCFYNILYNKIQILSHFKIFHLCSKIHSIWGGW